MSDSESLTVPFQNEMENPLLWPIFEVLKVKPSGWKVHTLAAHLNDLGLMPLLDSSPEKDLFKRNFLLMNALYQLQETLYPEKWLQVQAMDIVLFPVFNRNTFCIEQNDPLRDYYLHWINYEAESGEVKRLLNEFWTRYQHFVGAKGTTNLDRSKALTLFELPHTATDPEIRKAWRKLAMKWHPDRENGNTERFRELCEAWNILRN